MQYTLRTKGWQPRFTLMAKARAQFNLRVLKGKIKAVGPGKIALLEAIRDNRVDSPAPPENCGCVSARVDARGTISTRRLFESCRRGHARRQTRRGTTLSPTGHKLVKLVSRHRTKALRHTSTSTGRFSAYSQNRHFVRRKRVVFPAIAIYGRI